jgi:hypothetical protein
MNKIFTIAALLIGFVLGYVVATPTAPWNCSHYLYLQNAHQHPRKIDAMRDGRALCATE